MTSPFSDTADGAHLIAAYAQAAGSGDIVGADAPIWAAILDEALVAGAGDFEATRARVQRRVDEIGAGFRLEGEVEERRWPISPLPLVISKGEWRGIAAGVSQRAALIETVIADLYGPQKLVSGGVIPPALMAGSAHFLRSMVGVAPPGGKHMRLYAADLGRGPDGGWRVLADHAHAPVGVGYALENRLAVSRVLTGIQSRLNVERLAPFFAALRDGLAAACNRQEPRLALLTPGRFNQSYAEQAHLARYLGLLLVEGADLAVHEDQLYLRTIEGMKRIDGLWQRVAAHLVDPLALDSNSQIGVPGLIDAVAASNAMLANMPGCGVVESAAFAAFLPRLAVLLTGEALKLPNIATWWCGQPREAEQVQANLDDMIVAPAFAAQPLGFSTREGRLGSTLSVTEKAALIADMARRPIDYVGQEVVHLSTMPALVNGEIVPRPFTLRVFAAVDAAGQWTVMPGGLVRIGEVADVRAATMGANCQSADVIIHSDKPVAQVSLMESDETSIRRNPGTLPSRVADNLFWLGRYLERAEALLALVRASQGGSLQTDHGPALAQGTAARLHQQLAHYGASKRIGAEDSGIAELSRIALDDPLDAASVRNLLRTARTIGEGSRERLSPDFWTLLEAGFPAEGGVLQRVARLQERFAAFAGQASEHMGRTAGWRFHDLGRRIERALTLCRLVRGFGGDDALPDDLALLLELSNMQISYRQRYPTGFALARVRDLVALDPYNPRSIAYQMEEICTHFAALPRLKDDGMAEPHQAAALALRARTMMLGATDLNAAVLMQIEADLLALSDAIGGRFFLRGATKLRAAGMTFA
jgi:uncharacterized circularly permuted ATP-grasp superfamily protein/uncharacterized alpha-E superfamily protein